MAMARTERVGIGEYRLVTPMQRGLCLNRINKFSISVENPARRGQATPLREIGPAGRWAVIPERQVHPGGRNTFRDRRTERISAS
jgi:hypothetical protein